MARQNKGQIKPDYRDKSDELNKIIRRAALTLDPLASLKPLAEKSKIKAASIRAAIRRGYFTPGQAAALELAMGKELLPKEALCPEYSAQ